jgi:hypothetical protein
LQAKNEHRILLDGDVGKGLQERMRRWQLNVKMYLKEIGYEDKRWMEV